LWVLKGPDVLVRYDKPLTYEEAVSKKDLRFPIPKSARNICYAVYLDWQAFDERMKFEAPVEDCIKHIDTIISQHGGNPSYSKVEVTHVDLVGAGFLESAAWFDPESIKRGLFVGEDRSHKPRIWIDLDRGIFYFAEHD
jgi:hypothetical protein